METTLYWLVILNSVQTVILVLLLVAAYLSGNQHMYWTQGEDDEDTARRFVDALDAHGSKRPDKKHP